MKQKLRIMLAIYFLGNCTSVQISNPNLNTLVTIENDGSKCTESFRKKQFYLLFGTLPLNKIKPTDMFPDEKASYQISEEATWVDFMISVMGGQLISLSSKTIIVKKCDGDSIQNHEKNISAALGEKQIEEKLAKESALKTEALNQEKKDFEREKDSIIRAAIEKKKEEFEKEYAAKRSAALEEIVKRRLAEIEEARKIASNKEKEISNGEKFQNDGNKKTSEEIRKEIRNELESDFDAKSRTFERNYSAKKDIELKKIIHEKSEEIEKEYYKKKEREATLAIEKYLAKHKPAEENPNNTTLYLKKGSIIQGKLVKFESDFVNIEVNGEIKRIFVKEIAKVVLPKHR